MKTKTGFLSCNLTSNSLLKNWSSASSCKYPLMVSYSFDNLYLTAPMKELTGFLQKQQRPYWSYFITLKFTFQNESFHKRWFIQLTIDLFIKGLFVHVVIVAKVLSFAWRHGWGEFCDLIEPHILTQVWSLYLSHAWFLLLCGFFSLPVCASFTHALALSLLTQDVMLILVKFLEHIHWKVYYNFQLIFLLQIPYAKALAIKMSPLSLNDWCKKDFFWLI